jgi:hypothetical protein
LCAPPTVDTTPIDLTAADASPASLHLLVEVAAADALTCSGLPIGRPPPARVAVVLAETLIIFFLYWNVKVKPCMSNFL